MQTKKLRERGVGILDVTLHNKALVMKNLHKFFYRENLPRIRMIWESYYLTHLPGIRMEGLVGGSNILRF